MVSAVRERAVDPGFPAYDVRAWSDVLRHADVELAKQTAGETTAIVVAIGAHASSA